MKNNRVLIFAFVLLVIIIMTFTIIFSSRDNAEYISYGDFINLVKSGDVSTALIESKNVKFSLLSKSGEYYTDNPNSNGFKEMLLLNNIKLEDSISSEDVGYILDLIFYLLFFIMIGFGAYKISETFGGAKFKIIKNNKTKFSDICGMYELKNDMNKTVELLKNPKAYEEKGIRAPRGIILEGPPGNGKTLFARALAGEAGINFIATKGADFQSAIMSIGPMKIKAAFKKAKRNKPCILFIDEFDGIGERRNYTGTGIDKENNRIITAMLNEMDGFNNEEGVLVIGATNSYASLDAALIRPGRFDKKYNILNPDKETIVELIKMYTKGKKMSSKLNIDSLAKCFNGLSCSAIETLLNEAAMEAQISEKEEIDIEDIIKAGKKTNIIKINKI